MDFQDFGHLLSYLMVRGYGRQPKKKWTQHVLADKLGVHESTVGNWVRGKTFPNDYLLTCIVDAMALNNTEFEKQLFILHANSPKPQKHTSIKGLHKLTEFKSKMLQRAKDFSQKNTEASLLKALSILNQHLTSNPKEPNALALKGYVLWKLYFSGVEAQLDLLLEAKNFAEKALLIDPHHSEAQGCLVRIAWDQGENSRSPATRRQRIIRLSPR